MYQHTTMIQAVSKKGRQMSEEREGHSPGMESASEPQRGAPFTLPVSKPEDSAAAAPAGLAFSSEAFPTANSKPPLSAPASFSPRGDEHSFPESEEHALSQVSASSLDFAAPSSSTPSEPGTRTPSSSGSSSKAGIIVFLVSVLFIISASILWAYYAIGVASSLSLPSLPSWSSWFSSSSEEEGSEDVPSDEDLPLTKDLPTVEGLTTHSPAQEIPAPVSVEEEISPFIIPANSWAQGHEAVWEMKEGETLLLASRDRMYTYSGYPITLKAWDISGFQQPRLMWTEVLNRSFFIQDSIEINGKLYLLLAGGKEQEDSLITVDVQTGQMEEDPLAPPLDPTKYRNIVFEKDYYFQCEREEKGHTSLLDATDEALALALRNKEFTSCISYDYDNQELWSISPAAFYEHRDVVLLNLDNGQRVAPPIERPATGYGIYAAKTHQIIPILTREDDSFLLQFFYPDGSRLGSVVLTSKSRNVALRAETSLANITRAEAEHLIAQKEMDATEAFTYLGYLEEGKFLLRGGTSATIPDTLHYRIASIFYSADEEVAIAYSRHNNFVSWFGRVRDGQTFVPVLDSDFDKNYRLVRPDLLIVADRENGKISALAPKNR